MVAPIFFYVTRLNFYKRVLVHKVHTDFLKCCDAIETRFNTNKLIVVGLYIFNERHNGLSHSWIW
ncbi:hypothetical protein OUZ56_019229 [Daphnia magna]|uniref:Uncharacterized protein n=1 Tax=Daphnia magna TaxID=35525 RepID=A0ABQ9ZB08_9CRUS|nr:hypothetical protein OUZ56_019229 [Daphnia magna]